MLSLEQQLTAFSLISWLQQSQATLPPKPAAIVAQWMQEVRETVGKDYDARQKGTATRTHADPGTGRHQASWRTACQKCA